MKFLVLLSSASLLLLLSILEGTAWGLEEVRHNNEKVLSEERGAENTLPDELDKRRVLARCSKCQRLEDQRKVCVRGCGKNKRCRQNCNDAKKKINNCFDTCTTGGGGKKKVGQVCKNDSDCKNDACARWRFQASSQKKCCSGGQVVYDPQGTRFCGNLKSGAACFDNSMCETGTCNDSGRCLCRENSDCSSKYVLTGIIQLRSFQFV